MQKQNQEEEAVHGLFLFALLHAGSADRSHISTNLIFLFFLRFLQSRVDIYTQVDALVVTCAQS